MCSATEKDECFSVAMINSYNFIALCTHFDRCSNTNLKITINLSYISVHMYTFTLVDTVECDMMVYTRFRFTVK